MLAHGLRRRLTITLAMTVVIALAAPAAAAEWRGWRFLGTTCRANSAGLIYAHVRVRMIVANTGAGAHWASNMRVRARLVSPNAGLDYPSTWRTVRYPSKSASPDELLQDHKYSIDFAVNTDVMSPDQDWRLQVKLIWDRKIPWKDAVEKFDGKFTAPCPNDIHTLTGGT